MNYDDGSVDLITFYYVWCWNWSHPWRDFVFTTCVYVSVEWHRWKLEAYLDAQCPTVADVLDFQMGSHRVWREITIISLSKQSPECKTNIQGITIYKPLWEEKIMFSWQVLFRHVWENTLGSLFTISQDIWNTLQPRVAATSLPCWCKFKIPCWRWLQFSLQTKR